MLLLLLLIRYCRKGWVLCASTRVIKSLTKDVRKLETTFMRKQENQPTMAADHSILNVETR